MSVNLFRVVVILGWAMSMITGISHAHEPYEPDPVSVELAKQAGVRELDHSEVRLVLRDPLASLVALRVGLLRPESPSAQAFCHDLAPDVRLDHFAAALRDLLRRDCRATSSVGPNWKREFYAKHGRYAYWALLVATEGRRDAEIVEFMSAEGYRTNMGVEPGEWLLGAVQSKSIGAGAVDFWTDAYARHRMAAVAGLREADSAAVDELVRRVDDGALGSLRRSLSARFVTVVLAATGDVRLESVLPKTREFLTPDEVVYVELRRTRPRSDWRASLEGLVLIYSGLLNSEPAHLPKKRFVKPAVTPHEADLH